MTDDPPPPPPRHLARHLVEEVRNARSSTSPTVPDNRALFIGAMSDPLRRRIAFDVVERNCRERFAEGEDGIELFLQLLRLVQSARVDEAVEEFERRFAPLLDQELLQGLSPSPSGTG
jgi:hypothetical protein